MTRKAIMAAAHKQAKQAQYYNGGSYVVYLSFFLKKENWNMQLIQELSAEKEVFTLSIPYNSKSARKEAKEMGAKWNPETKVWLLECTREDVGYSMYLEKYLVNNAVVSDKKEGNFGTGCVTTYAKAMKYGYDAIER